MNSRIQTLIQCLYQILQTKQEHHVGEIRISRHIRTGRRFRGSFQLLRRGRLWTTFWFAKGWVLERIDLHTAGKFESWELEPNCLTAPTFTRYCCHISPSQTVPYITCEVELKDGIIRAIKFSYGTHKIARYRFEGTDQAVRQSRGVWANVYGLPESVLRTDTEIQLGELRVPTEWSLKATFARIEHAGHFEEIYQALKIA
ncbi:MAG: hypothetical protein HY397_01825 [Candidatus Doudnabacteria bacterium]|nr:hypothetical protein [Candidatus Doudnabacteria bacterium]